MPNSRVFRFGYAIIIVLLIIFLSHQVQFIFKPLVVLVQTLFTPFLVAGILFYLFRPVVGWLETKKIPRSLSILFIYLVFIGLFVLLGFLIGPLIQKQLDQLIKNLPLIIDSAKEELIRLSHHPWVSDNLDWKKITTSMTEYLKTSYKTIGANIAGFFQVITNIVLVFVTVPFILYYMLKEGDRFPRFILQWLPEKERNQGHRILSDMDLALSSYIKGQILVSVFVGVLVYIGYLIIGIEYSLILALITMFTNVIPFVGPLIGTVPAMIVALIDSPFMVVKVLIVAVVAQQLEGNLVSPFVMGKNLNIHPLTIIVLLLVAGSMAGFLGLLLVVPVYAVAKVVISHLYRLVMLRRQRKLDMDH